MIKSNKHRAVYILQIILAFAGMAVSYYLTHHYYNYVSGGDGSACTASGIFNCDVATSSRYASFLGFPTAAWGFAYYLFLVFFTIVHLWQAHRVREWSLVSTTLSIAALAVSIVLGTTSLLVLKIVCPYCAILYVISLLIFCLNLVVAAEYLRPISDLFKKVNLKHILPWGAAAVLCLAITLVVAEQNRRPLPENIEKIVQSYRQTTPVQINLKGVPVLRANTFVSTGPRPRLQVVEFSDFQCPGCGLQSRLLHYILEQYPQDVEVYFKNFPLDKNCNPIMKGQLHAHACAAAKAGICAHKLGAPGSFDSYHMEIFFNQNLISEDYVTKTASNLIGNAKLTQECMVSSDTLNQLTSDLNEGVRLNINGTPTVFVNGRQINGMLSLESVKFLLREVATEIGK